MQYAHDDAQAVVRRGWFGQAGSGWLVAGWSGSPSKHSSPSTRKQRAAYKEPVLRFFDSFPGNGMYLERSDVIELMLEHHGKQNTGELEVALDGIGVVEFQIHNVSAARLGWHTTSRWYVAGRQRLGCIE